MTETKITTDNMIDSKEVRQKYADRVEVLDKVKKVLLIPELEVMTLRQIADFYEVDSEIVRKCFMRNEKELTTDGVTIVKAGDISEKFVWDTTSHPNYTRIRGGIVITLAEGVTVMIPNGGCRVFSKRAVLRFGMLLRDSKIAQEVRTQLLNIVEHVAEEKPELLTYDIEKEKELLNAVAVAFATGDMMKFAEATMNLNSYKDRHIKAVESRNADLSAENSNLKDRNETLIGDNAILSGNILEWSNQASANRVVRLMADALGWSVGKAWYEIYKELEYKHGIYLGIRRGMSKSKKSLLSYLHHDEYESFYKTIAAMLHSRYVNPSKIFEKAKVLA